MKWLSLLFLLFLQAAPQWELAEVRKNYPLAATDREMAETLMQELSQVSETSPILLQAYKGATSALMAKYAKGAAQKKELFQEGVRILEHAIAQEPNNVEMRCLRHGIQENSPKFLKYQTDLETDKVFILTHYKTIPSPGEKEFVKLYIMQASGFNTEEKQGL